MTGCNCVVDSCVRLLWKITYQMYACTFAPFLKSDVSSKPIKFAAWTLTISMHQNHSQSGHILPVPVWLYGGSAYAPSKYLKDKLIIELYVTIYVVKMANRCSAMQSAAEAAPPFDREAQNGLRPDQ